MVLLPGATISSHQKRIAELAIKARLPAIYTGSVFAELGGLMAYGTDFVTYFRRAATYVDISKHVGRVNDESILVGEIAA